MTFAIFFCNYFFLLTKLQIYEIAIDTLFRNNCSFFLLVVFYLCLEVTMEMAYPVHLCWVTAVVSKMYLPQSYLCCFFNMTFFLD